MGDFFEEYKKRSIYGDALGPPTNATQSAARELLNMQKGGHGSGYTGGSSGQYIDIDLSFRFAWRRSLGYFLIGTLVSLPAMFLMNSTSGIAANLGGIASVPGAILTLIGMFRIAVNVLFISLQFLGKLWKLCFRGAAIGALGGVVISSTLPLPVYVSIIGCAVIGGAIALVRSRRKKESV